MAAGEIKEESDKFCVIVVGSQVEYLHMKEKTWYR
jgi:hypothetical protein